MFCSQCGKNSADGVAFCQSCGAQIGASTTPSQQATSQSNTFDPRSGAGPASVIPNEILGWNWGAAFLNWIWGLFNGVYIALLVFIPFVNIVFWIVLGVKGNEWAWRNKKWASVEAFKSTQRKWNIAGIIVLVLPIVVIPIIMMLSSLAVVSLGSAREKARDARRISDIMQIQTALELYYADQGQYPVHPSLELGSSQASRLTGRGFEGSSDAYNPLTYMGVVPADFEVPTGGYNYVSADGTKYVITFALEESVTGLSGALQATPNGICARALPECPIL
jgi:type II secretory pathway pseudopilin PulG